MRRLTTLVIAVIGFGSGCATEEGLSLEAQCDEIIDDLSRCYPELVAEGQCTEETIAAYDANQLGGETCDSIDDSGKADLFSFGGCGIGEHVCGYIFCCADYEITTQPSATDWDIVDLIENFQADAPYDVMADFETASRDNLLLGMVQTWEQDVVNEVGTAPVAMALERASALIEVPYDRFQYSMPAQHWGINLDHYLGGEVEVLEVDEQGRATRQLERMVLSPIHCDEDLLLGNLDMTKSEIIMYEQERAVVYWRVYYSDNDSTRADVGSVTFERYDETSTLVTFHSAHLLSTLGIPIDNAIVEAMLGPTFLEFAQHYGDVIGG